MSLRCWLGHHDWAVGAREYHPAHVIEQLYCRRCDISGSRVGES